MNKKYLWALLLILTLALSLASCEEKCKAHVDADDDHLCDNCGAEYDDGDEAPDITTVSVTISVKLDNGDALADVKFTLTRGEKSIELTSGQDGTVKIDLEGGIYQIDYDYESLPEYCSPDTFGFRVEEGTSAVDLTIVDNKPDGSAAKPFFISENETEITLAPDQELYFMLRVSTVRYINVYNAAAVIVFDGDSYAAKDGVASLVIEPDENQMGVANSVFSVKNTSGTEFTALLEVTAPSGSMENPIELTENSATVTVNCDTVVYYTWVATADGMLTLTTDNPRNSIYLRRVLENDVPVDQYTNGELSATIEVAEGDVITIGVSAIEAGKDDENKDYDIEISFELSIE